MRCIGIILWKFNKTFDQFLYRGWLSCEFVSTGTVELFFQRFHVKYGRKKNQATLDMSQAHHVLLWRALSSGFSVSCRAFSVCPILGVMVPSMVSLL